MNEWFIIIGAEGDTLGANAGQASAYFYERSNANDPFAFAPQITSAHSNADAWLNIANKTALPVKQTGEFQRD